MRAMSIYIERAALNSHYYLSKQDTIELNLKNPINGNGIFFDKFVFINYFEENIKKENRRLTIKNNINKPILEHHFTINFEEKIDQNNKLYREMLIDSKDFNSICDKEILLDIFIDNLTDDVEKIKVNKDATNVDIIAKIQKSIFSKQVLGEKIKEVKMYDKILEPCYHSLQILLLIKPSEIITINHYIKKYDMTKKIIITYN